MKERLIQILESIKFAFQALVINKMRTLLSVLGITIGIFCIISVLTVVDYMKNGIKSSIESLGTDVLYVMKWPWDFGEEYPWWKYMKRPDVSFQEMQDLERVFLSSEAIDKVAFTMSVNNYTIKAGDNSVSNFSGMAVSHYYEQMTNLNIQKGRYFTEFESKTGSASIILGSEMAKNLYDSRDPIGQELVYLGRKLTVIGVLEAQGDNLFGGNNDNSVLIPVNLLRKIMSTNRGRGEPMIMVKAGNNIPAEAVEDEVRGAMRNLRRLKPEMEDNFALNKSTMISKGVEPIYYMLTIGGWIIGGFSVLVGGFGVANIMFVSVRERTNQIGIQKSLGAKKIFILSQFLSESIMLTFLGGLIGIVFVFLLSLLFNQIMDINLNLSAQNFLIGNLISVVIGVVAGFVPAYSAAKMDPVEAIRTKI